MTKIQCDFYYGLLVKAVFNVGDYCLFFLILVNGSQMSDFDYDQMICLIDDIVIFTSFNWVNFCMS